jgi:uncharacterized phage protein (TIGR01671 family)
MKNHKFRLWNKKANDFVRGSLNEIAHFDLIRLSNYINGNRFYNLDEFEIQQFTGLFDKNNVPIYEGDIVTCRMQDAQTAIQKKFYAGIIHWNHSYWAVGEYKLFIMDDKDFRVIGNVFQNPELIA